MKVKNKRDRFERRSLRLFCLIFAFILILPAVLAADAPDSCSSSVDNIYDGFSSAIDTTTDVDWWKVTASSSGLLTIGLDVPSNSDFELELYSSCSTKINGSYKGLGIDESVSASVSSGTFYIKVYRWSGNTGGYTLSRTFSSLKPDGQSCSSNSECLNGNCAQGAGICWSDKSCSSSQCTSWYWASCHDFGQRCCTDDTYSNQWYCNSDKSWSECTNSNHNSCEQKGSYYCSSSDGVWKWRTCAYGCSSGACKTCKSDGETCSNPGTSGMECCSTLCLSNGKCGKFSNGESCIDGTNCQSGHCVNSVCAAHENECTSGSYKCNGNQQIDKCSDSDNDYATEWAGYGSCWCRDDECRDPDGYSCSSNSECYSNHCVHDVCRASDPYCGDSYCDAGESSSTCASDCKINFDVLSITSDKSTAKAGDTIKFNVTFKNNGISGIAYIGGGVIYSNGSYCNTEFKSIYAYAGATSNVLISWTVPSDFAIGTYGFSAGSWDSCTSGCAGACYSDGCCSGRQDTYSVDNILTVKKQNNQACSSSSECYSGTCGDYSKVCEGTCTNECAYCGCQDGYICGQLDSDGCIDKQNCTYGCDGIACSLAPDGTSCSKDSECKSQYCAGGSKKCWSPDSCSESQCQHWWYGHCENSGATCSLDSSLYCLSENFLTCSSYRSCEKQGNYYCALENGNWKWTACANGCNSNTGTCAVISCYSDSNCSKGFVGGAYCLGNGGGLYGDAYKTYKNATCINPGTTSSYCNYFYNDVLIDKCNYNEICQSGQCTENNLEFDALLEDAEHGVKVYKQPGDLVSVIVRADDDLLLRLDYPSEFILVSGEYSDGLIQVYSNKENVFVFKIPEDAEIEHNYQFTIGSKTENVVVINDPALLIVTDRKALMERYSGQPEKVYEIINEAYNQAASRRGIVYSMDSYISGRPWNSFSDYNEGVSLPRMTSNSYSMKIADLINSKCNGCTNIMLVGDDYVIPYNRVDYNTIEGWNLWLFMLNKHSQQNYLYTDQPYIKENKVKMGDLMTLFDKEKYGKIIVVTPDSMSAELRNEITSLKDILSDYNSDVEEIKSSEVGCNSNSRSELGGGTLILIGNRENNNAIKCVPWFNVGEKPTDTFKAYIEIERNVWGDRKYAVVVSGEDVLSGVKNFQSILENPYLINGEFADSDTLFIHDMSNPPSLPTDELMKYGSHAAGFVLGTCDKGGTAEQISCSGSDFVLSMIPPTDILTDIRDVAIYCVGSVYDAATGNKVNALNGMICGGSALGTGITLGKYVAVGAAFSTGGIAGGGAIAAEAGDAATTGIKRIMKIAKIAFEGEAGRFFKFADKVQMFKPENFLKFLKVEWTNILEIPNAVRRMGAAMQDYKYAWRAIHRVFSEDALAEVATNIEAYESIAKSSDNILKNADKLKITNLADFAPHISKESTKLKYIKNIEDISKLNSEAADAAREIHKVKGIETATEFLIEDAPNGLKSGRIWDIKGVKRLQDSGEHIDSMAETIIDPVTKKSITEFDAVSNVDKRIFELKDTTVVESTAFLISESTKKFSKYGEAMKVAGKTDYKRILVLEGEASSEIISQLKNIGWDEVLLK